MSFYSLIEEFHKKSIFWPPEAFTLNRIVDERVIEWCENVLFKNEDLVEIVGMKSEPKLDSLEIQIRKKSCTLLTKCIFEYWLFLINRQCTVDRKNVSPFASMVSVWICSYLQLDISAMPCFLLQYSENATSNYSLSTIYDVPSEYIIETNVQEAEKENEIRDASISFTISSGDIASMKQDELMFWKYKLIVFASQLDNENALGNNRFLYDQSRQLLREIEARL